MLDKLRNPICDLRFLLNRGYKRATAIKVVADKYRLPLKDRNLLVRAIFPNSEAKEHKKKCVGIEAIRDNKVVIDGYNVLITVESAIEKKKPILCDDGFIRDISAVFGKYKLSRATPVAVGKILKVLKQHSPKNVLFIFDSQVSFSGELCRLIREEMKELGLNGGAETSEKADYDIIKKRWIVCSSDSAIIKKVDKVVDLPRHLNPKFEIIPSCNEIVMGL